MKVYLLKDEDFDRLVLMLSKDPRHGQSGGSSVMLSPEEQQAHDEAHRFYNYNVRTWIDEVKK